MRRRDLGVLPRVSCSSLGDRDESSVDRDSRGRLVEVDPPEPEQFVAAHSGERRDPQRREQPMTGGGSQERLQFPGGPGLLLDLRDGPESRGVGDERDVAGDEAAADGVFQRAHG